MSRIGRQSFLFENSPRIIARTSIVGPKEGKGPLADEFDLILDDDLLGMKSWELAEGEMVRRAAELTAEKAKLSLDDVQIMIAGDLNNQIIASSFAARSLGLPFLGQYGACSTFVQSALLGCALICGGFADNALCAASSHFCTAERQFRFPLELGNQRPPQASWTATACGCILLGRSEKGLRIPCGTIGRVIDLKIKDANHMGAAMAPAVYDTIAAHFADMGRSAVDYDLVVTGDLGWIGKNLLMELFRRGKIDMPDEKLLDCGNSLFYQEQDPHAGGSGCGCVAAVSCGWIMGKLERGEIRRALIAGSGAMLSPTSTLQGESIPAISYAMCVEGGC